MVKLRRAEQWVVYRMTLHGKSVSVNAVCDQTEWAAMEASRPGFYTLVQSGITNEGEAERLARGNPAADQASLARVALRR